MRLSKMRKQYKTLLILLCTCLAIIIAPKVTEAKSFPDIPTNYEKEIEYLVDLGIIKGYPNGMFMPNNSLSRAEAYVMVARALQLDETKQPTIFKDVPQSHYASGAIQSLVNLGIIEPATNIYPSKMITRGEMATLLVKAFGWTDMADDIYFFDVLEKNSLQQDIFKLVTAGIITGYTDGTFKPQNLLTRTEFSILVVRSLDESYRQYDRVLKKETYVVTAEPSLNIRSGAGTNFASLGKLYKNEQVDVYLIEGKWAKIIYNNKVGYIHSDYIRKVNNSMTNFTIAIDAGHGGYDPGATGNGLKEKDINLSVALYAQEELKKLGINVFMVRSDDTYYTLQERVNRSVNNNADAFLSIHTNSASGTAATGSETYYSSRAVTDPTRGEKSKQLATFVQKRIVEAWGLKDRGIKEGKFYVIYQNPLPSALLELGFINNPTEAKILGDKAMQQKAGKAVAQGIQDYVTWLQTK